MPNSLVKRLAEGAVALTDDALAAAQLEAFVTATTVPASQQAWQSASIQSRAAWAGGTWAGLRDESLLLTAAQARALWVRVVAESVGDAAVIHTHALADSAQRAWQLLFDWNLDSATLRARADESTFATFLSWADRYRARLDAAGWIDSALLTSRLSAAVERAAIQPTDIVVADPAVRVPAFDRLLQACGEAGSKVTTWQPTSVSRDVLRIGLGSRREEIDAALTWAYERINQQSTERIAIVIPPEVGSEALVRRWCVTNRVSSFVDDSSSCPIFVDGTAAAIEPLLGAALDALQLLGSGSNFVTLSRVLRSSFFDVGGDDTAARAVVEAELRTVFAAQAEFPAAFRYGGLADRLRGTVPSFADQCARILGWVDALPRVQSATRWAALMDEVLRELGWQGTQAAATDEAVGLWARATNEFCMLSPILGGLTYERALSELEAVLRRLRRSRELPMSGITIFSSLDQVGPGYDAAWCVGMSDRSWPPAPRANSLLPLGLQRSHGMPFATPEATLARYRELTSRFVARLPVVICSYPVVVDEEPAAPSALIKGFDHLRSVARSGFTPQEQSRAEQPCLLEVVEDRVPPMTEKVLPGGVRTIALQARCPLHAFIEGRLRAQPLDRPERGIGARLRGIVAHRALELVYASLGSRAVAFEMHETDQLRGLVTRCAHSALQRHLPVVGPAQRALRELERTRLEALVMTLVQRDLGRDDFTIRALEVREAVEIDGLRIRCRIDRVDCLADGRLAIIDYKTGRAVATRGLLAERLAEPQLPLYALALGADVAAVVYVAVQPNSVVFRGIWEPAELFPGRPTKLPEERNWGEQLELWKSQITALVEELVRGDGRIFPDAVESLRDELATLSRACEVEFDVDDAIAGGIE